MTLLEPDIDRLEVELRSSPARTVAAISGTVALDRVLGWYDEAMAELDSIVGAATITGADHRIDGGTVRTISPRSRYTATARVRGLPRNRITPGRVEFAP